MLQNIKTSTSKLTRKDIERLRKDKRNVFCGGDDEKVVQLEEAKIMAAGQVRALIRKLWDAFQTLKKEKLNGRELTSKRVRTARSWLLRHSPDREVWRDFAKHHPQTFRMVVHETTTQKEIETLVHMTRLKEHVGGERGKELYQKYIFDTFARDKKA
jgi:hypothetical protein